MKIYPLELTEKDGLVCLQYQVQLLDSNRTLWYTIDRDYQDFTTDLLDGPLLALMIPAMSSGEDITVQGTISERLFYNLNGPFQAGLKILFPTLKKIRINPADVRSIAAHAPGVAAGFTCGIDSFALVADHYYAKVTQGFKLTHLMFFNVGSHGPESGAERLFEARYEGVKAAAQKIGLPLIKVNSNLDSFYSGFLFKDSFRPRNVSVPLLLQNGIGRFLLASSSSYDYIYHKAPDAFTAEPIELPLLSTETIDIVATGSQHTRVEKTISVGNLPVSYDHLDVCLHPRPDSSSCSRCKKCMTVQLTLEILGLLRNYEKVFNLKIYEKERDKFIGRALVEESNYRSEIRSLIKEKHFPIPLRSYHFAFQYFFHALFLKFTWLIKGIARKLQKHIKFKRS